MNSKRPKTWLITGVSTGLGRCLMNAALDRGDIVVGTLRNMALKEEIEARAPGRAFIVPLDVDHADQAVPAVEEAVRLLGGRLDVLVNRSEEHTSELQSLMRISYAVFCLKKKNTT